MTEPVMPNHHGMTRRTLRARGARTDPSSHNAAFIYVTGTPRMRTSGMTNHPHAIGAPVSPGTDKPSCTEGSEYTTLTSKCLDVRSITARYDEPGCIVDLLLSGPTRQHSNAVTQITPASVRRYRRHCGRRLKRWDTTSNAARPPIAHLAQPTADTRSRRHITMEPAHPIFLAGSASHRSGRNLMSANHRPDSRRTSRRSYNSPTSAWAAF